VETRKTSEERSKGSAFDKRESKENDRLGKEKKLVLRDAQCLERCVLREGVSRRTVPNPLKEGKRGFVGLGSGVCVQCTIRFTVAKSRDLQERLGFTHCVMGRGRRSSGGKGEGHHGEKKTPGR